MLSILPQESPDGADAEDVAATTHGDGEEKPAGISEEEAAKLVKFDEIQDAGSVFKLAYLEERKKNATLLMELRRKMYDERITALKQERHATVEAIAREVAAVDGLLIQARHDIEQKHAIDLKHYAYDDELGVLRKVVEEVKPGDTEIKATDH